MWRVASRTGRGRIARMRPDDPVADRVSRRSDHRRRPTGRGRGERLDHRRRRRPAYLDAAGGAIVVNVGHGRDDRDDDGDAGQTAVVRPRECVHDRADRGVRARGRGGVADGWTGDLPRVRWIRGDRDGAQARARLPRRPWRHRTMDGVRAVGELSRQYARRFDLSGRRPLRRPYEGWLGRFRHLSAAYPYRAGYPGASALDDGRELADELDHAIHPPGPTRSRRSSRNRSSARRWGGRAAGSYWPAIAEVCRRHGVLLIADEVMTGFGRTGRWFGVDHWACGRTARRREGRVVGLLAVRVRRGVGRGVRDGDGAEPGSCTGSRTRTHQSARRSHARCCASCRTNPRRVRARRRERDSRPSSRALADHPRVGEIRGRGLLVGIEIVDDRESRRPYPRVARVTEAIVAAARARGVLLYSGTGTPTAPTATRSCSGRRSSSPTTS